MKRILTLVVVSFSLTALGQQMTSKEWNEQSKTNIRLLPKYGHLQKTEEQKQADQKFINETIQQDLFKGDRGAASNHSINLGFNYLYRGDVKIAMYRFNQAYLLDSTNSDIYWGYGAVYMTLRDYEKAKRQYQEGLSFHPNSTHLLTDYGTYFMAQCYRLQSIDEKNAKSNLDSAIAYINKSYQIDNKDQNTTYKLSICYWLKGDCDKAWQYYDECKALGGQPITEDFTNSLKEKCKRSK